MVATTEAYHSIGRVADRFECRRGDVEKAAKVAGVHAKSWNDVPYFEAADIERLRKHLPRHKRFPRS